MFFSAANKMWNKMQCTSFSFGLLAIMAIICSSQLFSSVSGRSLSDGGGGPSCRAIKDIIALQQQQHRVAAAAIPPKGLAPTVSSICNGGCCSGNDELYLQNKSINSFVDSLRIQSKEISNKMVDTSNVYKGYIAELFEETKNKTINIFSKVYHRMTPATMELVEKLFLDIKSSDGHSLSGVMLNFFKNLFPIAYHHVLYPDNEEKSSPAASMDFQEDYKRCLVHSFDNLMAPFGDTPRKLVRSIERSLTTSNMFVMALERGAEVLSSVDQLDEINFEAKCSSHLLKMNFCQDCNGVQQKVKSCRGYCLNVMRGCLTQHVGSLDRPWTTYAESLEHLVETVRSKDGYEAVLRGLDGRLSEAVMHFIQHGAELEQKVKKSCGTPSMASTKLLVTPPGSIPPNGHKRLTPHVTEMLQLLVTIDKSKNIYTQIVDSYCDDHEEFQKDDIDCWMGDRVGRYTQPVMDTTMTTQKYNPEVPYEGEGFRVNTQVNELVDKLISNRQKMSNVMSQHKGITDAEGMISDMAEGSGSGPWRSDFPDDSDFGVDGSGSGDGYSGLSKVPIPERPTYQPPVVIHKAHDDSGGAATTQLHLCLAIAMISLLLLRSR